MQFSVNNHVDLRIRQMQVTVQVTVIDNLDALDQIEDDWSRVYDADQDATVFLSWPWLRSCLDANPDRWCVLAVRPHDQSSHVGFLPLTWGQADEAPQLSELRMGCSPLADYTGFVIHPDHKHDAVSALGRFVADELMWDRIEFRDVLDSRLDDFLACFNSDQFTTNLISGNCCPYIPLPNEWDAYLRESLGTATRQSLRRKLKRLERQEGFQIVATDEHNFHDQIEILFSLWQNRWGQRRAALLDRYRKILEHCFHNDLLWLNVLSIEGHPLAALAAFRDKPRRSFGFYISGFDDSHGTFSPGRAIVAYSIQHAIEHGYDTYDFLRGEERYKFSFGASRRYNRGASVCRV